MEQEENDGLIQMQHSMATARVPEEIGSGVFANEIVMLKGSGELAIDFIQSIAKPRKLVSRVLMNSSTAEQLVKALGKGCENCTLVMNGCTFVLGGGGVKWVSPGEKEEKQDEGTVTELYESTKTTDGVLMGRYANMISASQSNGNFCIDFILCLYPRSVVTSRVFMSMNHATELMNALKTVQW